MKAFILFILLTLLLSVWSCRKEIDNPDPIIQSNAYFPVSVGNWISYQIEDINIDKLSAVNDTVRYQIKEVVESLVENLNDYKSYRLERYFRYSELDEWKILNVWQIRQYPRSIHKIEENVEFVRLVTPVRLNDKWDGNTFNENDKLECIVKTIKDSLIHNQATSIASIEHQNQSSLIDKNYSAEQYAKNIGLIQKTIIDVELNIDPSLDWDQRITKGRIFYQNYINSSL